MYATVLQSIFSCGALLWTNKSFVEFIFEDNVLNELFKNKFPSKITHYMLLLLILCPSTPPKNSETGGIRYCMDPLLAPNADATEILRDFHRFAM